MTRHLETEYPVITLSKGKDRRVRKGHLWIFSNELEHSDTDHRPGEIVRVKNHAGKCIGTGFYNPGSLIAVRLLSNRSVIANESFFANRIRQAVDYRKRNIKDTNALRLVHSESDGLPGLIIDQYNHCAVIQILSAGMELQRNIIINTIKNLIKPSFIVLRNDHSLRSLEGLQNEKRIIGDEDSDVSVSISENSLTFVIDPMDGQKTGFYIDQRDNRKMFRHYISPGDQVLDAFCHDGGFAMNAVLGGAGQVTAMDISAAALDKAKTNAEINNLSDSISFQEADLLKKLPVMAITGINYDAINLDPPNFAPRKKAVGAALRAYRKLHAAAFGMLKTNGILAASCCSHHVTEEAFLDTLRESAARTGKRVQVLHRGSNPPDHPVLPEMPETGYLKFFILRTVSME